MTGKILIVLINWLKRDTGNSQLAEISTTNSTEDDWDSLDEYDDLINSKNEDKAWMLREQIANNSKESSIQSTNQIRETAKKLQKFARKQLLPRSKHWQRD